ncbi:uncharacterized protein ATNIH1004_007673 [Aspergillus tanneri]|uniref:Uncharacterized protein n=1 Tax=Aspergillus tanneri TaxID=1220188 RepID=A0A5M9MK30_9EURO|nr:uncharacterized protein ATNIH1004_007673 [Aspergillus tanneri]KAA8646246.1 hypothetical protein ATNIH1004_007673 [Aspergillus tanneri]
MSQVQQYWLPGYGLSRHIVLGHIQYFLGPSASVRPDATDISLWAYLSHGSLPLHLAWTDILSRRHLLLTLICAQEQIDDLAVMSREYERQESLRMAGDSIVDHSSRQFEPYINEIVPVRNPGPRRRAMEPEPRRSR